jgi:hypothetical protein
MVAGSAAKIEVSWDDVFAGNFPETPARKAFREAVEVIANRARTAVPELNGRMERAIQIILNGDLSIAPDGQGTIASQSNGNGAYAVGREVPCSCKDHPKAPKHLCKHVLAYISSHALRLLQSNVWKPKLRAMSRDVSSEADPTEAVSTSTAHIPAQFLTEIHGRLFVQYASLLAMAHERGLVNLSAHFISVTDTLALAEATAGFADGKTFSECADATPHNVGSSVRAYFPKIAPARAKAHCLRDALNISVFSVEELET